MWGIENELHAYGPPLLDTRGPGSHLDIGLWKKAAPTEIDLNRGAHWDGTIKTLWRSSLEPTRAKLGFVFFAIGGKPGLPPIAKKKRAPESRSVTRSKYSLVLAKSVANQTEVVLAF